MIILIDVVFICQITTVLIEQEFGHKLYFFNILLFLIQRYFALDWLVSFDFKKHVFHLS